MTKDFEHYRFVWHEPERLKQTRAILVGIYKTADEKKQALEHLQELKLLAETQNIPVVDEVCYSIRTLKAAAFLTEGKLEELARRVREKEANFVIFDEEITPAQQRNLEKLFNALVVDRTEVILGVFAMRAQTKEAQLQVELAEVKYYLPRLKRMWTHLSRQVGGGGGASGGGYLKGEGEKQIEIDKRILKRKSEQLSREIKEIALHRAKQRAQRVRADIPVIAIVGYTNAGKSTLMNLLTQANVYTEDKLFATLDTTTRKYTLKNNQEVLFIDTVGFIRKLPHLLVAAFKSTLEEAVFSELILHVIDASHPNAFEQAKSSLEVLKALDAHDTPIITVLNKIDAIDTKEKNEIFQKLRLAYPRAKEISALENTGLDALVEEIIYQLQSKRMHAHLRIPQSEYSILALATREGKIFRQEYDENDVLIEVELPKNIFYRFETYLEKQT